MWLESTFFLIIKFDGWYLLFCFTFTVDLIADYRLGNIKARDVLYIACLEQIFTVSSMWLNSLAQIHLGVQWCAVIKSYLFCFCCCCCCFSFYIFIQLDLKLYHLNIIWQNKKWPTKMFFNSHNVQQVLKKKKGW